MAKKKKVKRDKRYCWVIAYVDRKFIGKIQEQLNRSLEYQDVKVFIPTVKVLKKTFKGSDHFDEIPLLFNYGFFKIPRKYAIHRNYLDNLQANVSAIYGWVKDPAKQFKRRTEERSMEGDDKFISVATATSDEIAKLIKASENIGAHSAEDLLMVKPGERIILKGYPFDNIEAEFVSMDKKRKKARVKLTSLWNKEVEVGFDNVFFTIYQNDNFNDALGKEKSLDEMEKSGKLDKMINKNWGKSNK